MFFLSKAPFLQGVKYPIPVTQTKPLMYFFPNSISTRVYYSTVLQRATISPDQPLGAGDHRLLDGRFAARVIQVSGVYGDHHFGVHCRRGTGHGH